MALAIFALVLAVAIAWIAFPFLMLDRFKKLQTTSEKMLVEMQWARHHLEAMRKYYEGPSGDTPASTPEPKRESLLV